MQSIGCWKDISKYRDELFGLSIISIIVFHYCESVIVDGRIGFLRTAAIVYNLLIGSVGVDIFLFLSGLGIYYSIRRNSIGLYYKKRIKRVVIPYTIVGACFWCVKDVVLQRTSIWGTLYDFSLLSFWGKGVRTFWFISLICLLYWISPFFKTSGNRGLFIVIGVSIIGSLLLFFAQEEIYNRIEIAITRIPGFFIGMIGAELAEKGRQIKKSLLISIMISLPLSIIMVLKSIPLDRAVNSLYGIFLILAYCSIRNRWSISQKTSEALKHIGAYSLELYLVHVAIRNILSSLGISLSYLLYYLLMIGVSVLLSIGLKKMSSTVSDLIM